MAKVFGDFDVDGFWQDATGWDDAYRSEPVTSDLVASIEAELGYRLPPSYVEFMGHRNGGIPHRNCHRTPTPTSWASDHVALTGVYGIGRTKPYSLAGELGSLQVIEDWGYPRIGIYFADCPSAGHDMVGFDYRACGPKGEPAIVHVDQEVDYRITPLAPSFEAFVRGLQTEEAFDP